LSFFCILDQQIQLSTTMKNIFLSFLCLLTTSLFAQDRSVLINSDFNTMATLNSGVNKIIPQGGKFILGGDFSYYGKIKVIGICRIFADGSLDNSFNKLDLAGNSNATIYDIAEQPDGKLIIAGSFTFTNGMTYTNIMRIDANGALDNTFNPGIGANNVIYSIKLQNDGKVFVCGYFSSFNGEVHNGIVRLNNDGSIDNTINFGTAAAGMAAFGGSVFGVDTCADGKIIVAGCFDTFNGITRNGLVRLNKDGSVDNAFVTNLGFNTYVYTPTVLPDGKIVIGGYIRPNTTSDTYSIYKYNADGTVDNSFNYLGLNDICRKIKLLPDGKLLIGGSFTKFNSTSLPQFGRLNTDGTLDTGFMPTNANNYGGGRDFYLFPDNSFIVCGGPMNFEGYNYIGIAKFSSSGVVDNSFNRSGGIDGYIKSLALQTDGKILVGGYIRSYSGSYERGIQRVDNYGTPDPAFDVGTGADTVVECIRLQSNGQVLLGGGFKNFNGTLANSIVRLNANGSRDLAFATGTGFDSAVYDMQITPTGEIIVAGKFAHYNGSPAPGITKLNKNGTINSSFNVGLGSDGLIKKVLLQPDGKIICIGTFTSFNGVTTTGAMRLNADGSTDNTFNIPTFSGELFSGAIQSDGKILIGGAFFTVNGQSRLSMARLFPDGTIDGSFTVPTFLYGITKILPMPDGKILASGFFNDSRLIRFLPNGAIDPSYFQPTDQVFNTTIFDFIPTPDGELVVGGYAYTFFGMRFNSLAKIRYAIPYYNTISGASINDQNKDCVYQSTEQKNYQRIIRLTPGPYYTTTDNSGAYSFKVDTGNVTNTVQQIRTADENFILESVCPSDIITVNTSGSNNNYTNKNFFDRKKSCSLLELKMTVPRLRRCGRNTILISYSNIGSVDVANAEIKVVLPEYLRALSSVPGWNSKNDSLLIYQIPLLGAGQTGGITLIDSVVCGNQGIVGLAQCISASITPKLNCVTPDAAWDKSSIKVVGKCTNGIAYFTIQNAGSGNMADSSTCRIYQNDTLIFSGKFKLAIGAVLPVSIPANGSTIRLEADQRPKHPGSSRPRATVEGCIGSTQSLADALKGLVNTVTQDDLDAEEEFICLPIVASLDPNEKEVSPTGVTSNHYVDPSAPLKYTIHFQNTGTDTAFYVKIVDTLDMDLDVTRFSIGNSSHPVSWAISGHPQPVATFEFKNILLTDSTTNNLESQGFIEYTIFADTTKSFGSSIRNKAYIYFDYNDPIITNETMQVLGMPVISDYSKSYLVTEGTVINGIYYSYNNNSFSVFPNPLESDLNIDFTDNTSKKIILYSANGISIKEINGSRSSIHMDVSDLPQGLYLLEVVSENEERMKIKLVKNK